MKKREKSRLAKKRDEEGQAWRNEHGQPNFEFLKSLADENSPSSLEKLKAIAQDLNVHYGHNNTNEELIDEILSSIRSDPTITS